MRALILAAGLGTRLRPLTYARAKAAVPVNGEPLVRRVIGWLVGQNVTDLVINLHHLPCSVAAAVGDGRDLGARVRYSWENPVLGSAGGPRHALPLLLDGMPPGDDAFLVVNADTVTDLDVRRMMAAHRESGALVTMALIPNPRPDVYGSVVVRDGRVTGFTRPGRLAEGVEPFHFIGVQVARAEAFSSLPDGVPAESVMAVYPRLLEADPAAVAAHVAAASFRDIGSPADLLHTALEFAGLEGDRLIGADARIHRTAQLRRTAVWDRVTVGAGAVLDECIVSDDVRIPDGARYRRTAIAPYTGTPPAAGERIDGPLLIREF